MGKVIKDMRQTRIKHLALLAWPPSAIECQLDLRARVRESAQHVQEDFLASTRAVMQLHDRREVKQREELAETLELEAEGALAGAEDWRSIDCHHALRSVLRNRVGIQKEKPD